MPLLTQSAFLKALGWTLVNSLWQMGLLWLTYQLMQRIFHQAASRFRHGLALSLLAFGAFGSTMTFIAAYFFDRGAPDSWSGLVNETGNWVQLILPYCSSLYLLVLGALLVRYSHQYWHSRRISRTGLSKVPAQLRLFVTSTARQMGIHPLVQVYGSSLVDVPMTLGFLKPVILLPLAMMSNLTMQQVEAILVHELAHIRRKDYLLNLAVTFIGLLFFFNPFARLLIGHLQREREHCCDEEVLQFRYDPHSYVSALLSLARQHRQGRIALAATGSGDDQFLLQRARKILQQRRSDKRPGARPFFLLFLTALITVLSLSAPKRQQRAVDGQPVTLAGQRLRFAGLPVGSGAPAKVESRLVYIVNSGIAAEQRVRVTATAHEKKVAPAPKPKHRVDKEEQDGDENGMGNLVASTDDEEVAAAYTQPAALTEVTPRAPRDNSLGKHEDEGGGPSDNTDDFPPTENLVFVPNSSFSFKYIDTARPQDKLTWLEGSNENAVKTQLVRLEKEMAVQLELLHRSEAQARALATSSQLELKRLLAEQIRVQKDYIKKLDVLRIRLTKVSHRVTVYI